MNYKQQIEQKAREYADQIINGKDRNTQPYNDIYFAAKEGYEAGAEAAIEIANTWINVEDRLPEFDPAQYPNGDYQRYLVKVSVGSISPKEVIKLSWLINKHKWSGEMDWVTVTHWKPITL